MANTFKFGSGNWAVKDGYALAYNDENNNFKPLPFDFTRASSATRVNKQGLIETVPSGKPRIDFINNTNGHLLLEPSRTNYITQSIDLADWSSFVASGTVTRTNDYSTSPDGLNKATRLQMSGGSSIQWTYLNVSNLATYASFYVKSTGSSSQNFRWFWNNGSNGQDFTATTEWQRFEVAVSQSSTLPMGFTTHSDLSASDILVWGVQSENGSYPTSYIPTEGSTVTRSKDDVDTNYGDINTLSGEVSVYFNLLPQVSAASNNNKCVMFGFNSASNNNSYANLRFGSTNWGSRIQGTTGNNFNDLGVDKTTEIKAVMVLTQSGYSLYANGSTAVASGSYGGTAPTINSVAYVQILNDSEDRGIYKIKELKVYNTALTSTEAINLTS